jgi:hypothetical protein
VQRSGVSHILTGRNKPSLDFISKILSSYPELDSDWLLFGKGQMMKKLEDFQNFPEKEEKQVKTDKPPTVQKNAELNFDEEISENMEMGKKLIKATQDSKESQNLAIVKIIVFYSDNSFEEYSPNKS